MSELNLVSYFKESYDLLQQTVHKDNLVGDGLTSFLGNILEYLVQHSSSKIVEIDTIKQILACDEKNNYLCVLNSLNNTPQIDYDNENCKLQSIILDGNIFPNPKSKTKCFLRRYNIHYYRLHKSKAFQIRQIEGNLDVNQIIYLLTCAKPDEHIICLGMIYTNAKQLCIEDPTGTIPLEISETIWHDGIYTETSFVLVEGYVMDNIFYALAIGFPPIESELDSRNHLGDINFFTTSSADENFQGEISNDNSQIVILSDIYLDDVKVKVKFNELLNGFDMMDKPPDLFIFCGSFISTTNQLNLNSKKFYDYYNYLFVELAFDICKNKNLCKISKFIFVPHLLSDPGLTGILPRPPLEDVIIDNFYKAVQSFIHKRFNAGGLSKDSVMKNQSDFNLEIWTNFLDGISGKPDSFDGGMLPSSKEMLANQFIFASNPCRIRFKTFNIIVFREDIISKLLRNSLHSPVSSVITSCQQPTNNTENNGALEIRDLEKHFVHTILSQAYLAPLPYEVCPKYYEFDHSLDIYPLPQLIVCADKFMPYTYEHPKGCTVINPGSFSKNNFCFKVYYPSTNITEDSSV